MMSSLVWSLVWRTLSSFTVSGVKLSSLAHAAVWAWPRGGGAGGPDRLSRQGGGPRHIVKRWGLTLWGLMLISLRGRNHPWTLASVVCFASLDVLICGQVTWVGMEVTKVTMPPSFASFFLVTIAVAWTRWRIYRPLAAIITCPNLLI